MSDEQPNRIRVFLRVRPPRKEEEGWFGSGEFGRILRDSSKVPDPEHSIIIDKSGKKYDFDRFFDEASTQQSVFKEGAVPTLENVFSGYCGAILAYGQTGTGKTHTMQGYDKDPTGQGRGIIPRCADYIFNRVAKQSDTNFNVNIAFVQIYLDKLQDLFNTEASEISINPESERVELPGITTIEVGSPAEIMKYFYHGEKFRVTRKTKMNDTSSRGHAALIINVSMTPKNHDGSAGTKFGKLVLVDLAGYERYSATGITAGIAAEEAKKINASLLALGSVVNALADASAKKTAQHIPYRNAKLTRLLKDCLGGTSVTAIICTIGPCDRYNQETAGTLYFGWRAMAVKVDAKIKEKFDPNQYTNNLKNKVAEYSERIKTMRAWWLKGKKYPDYVAKYGDFDGGDLDEEETAIMEEMAKTVSRDGMASVTQQREAAAAQAMSTSTGVGGTVMASRTRMGTTKSAAVAQLPSSVPQEDDILEGDNAEVREVKSRWNEELRSHNTQAVDQEELLRLKHLQDLEEAREAGIDPHTLEILKQEHAQELAMMREQNQELRREIVRQKNKEEVAALLHAASDMNDVTARGRDARYASQEDKRIAEIVEHLQETSETKDEVLQRMFELICFYERQIENHDANLQAIAQASSGGDQGYQKMLTKAKTRQEELQTALFLKDEEIAALRQARGSGSSPSGGDPGLSNLWSKASSINPTRPDIEELQTHALLLKEKFEDACQQIIARGGGGSVPRTVGARPTGAGPTRTATAGGTATRSPAGATRSGVTPARPVSSLSGTTRPAPSATAAPTAAAPSSSSVRSGSSGPSSRRVTPVGGRPGNPSPPSVRSSASVAEPTSPEADDKKKKFWDKFEKLHRK